MPEYRKKPIVIEAYQLFYAPGHTDDKTISNDWPYWLKVAFFKAHGTEGSVYRHANGLFAIWTLEGIMEINPGDYVIQEIQGELYPCKPDIFEATYETAQSCDTPGFAWTDMAASAYRAYAASTGNKNFRGEPMPAFEGLPITIQTAWEAAVRHVGNAIEEPGALNPRKEQSWRHWVRPQDKAVV